MKGETVTIFDVETGGLNPFENPITQIALINFNLHNLSVNFEFTTFVKPYAGLEITQDAIQRSMINMKDVENGTDSKELVKVLKKNFKQGKYSAGRISKNTILAGHNIMEFDCGFMEVLFGLYDEDLYDHVAKKKIDTLSLSEQIWPNEPKHNLSIVCERLGYKLKGAHGALADTRANYEVYKRMRKIMNRNIDGEKIIENTSSGETETKRGNYFNI